MEKTNGVLEQDVAKKKKRRKRKNAAKKNTVAPIKTETKKVEVVKEEKKVEENKAVVQKTVEKKPVEKKETVQKTVENQPVEKKETVQKTVEKKVVEKKEPTEGKVTYNTFEIEKIKADVADKISYHSVPINVFSMKNLMLTISVICIVIAIIVVGYYVGAFNFENKPNNEFGDSHKVTGMVSEIEFANHTFYVPFGFERVDSNTSVKILDSLEGTSIELLSVSNEIVDFDEEFVETYRLDLQEDGYVIYSSYILDNGMLVYTGLDSIFSTVKIIYVANEGTLYKILVSNEYDELNDEVYDFVEEFIGR